MCLGCQKVHYENPQILISCLAYYGDQLLMCRRAHDPGKGLWAAPGGYMEQGESIEEAAVRETEEETGVKLRPEQLDLYGILSLPDLNQVYVTLVGRLIERPALQPGPESLEVALMREGDIRRDDWAFASVLIDEGATILFREIRSGRFSIHKSQMGGHIAGGYQIKSYPLNPGRRAPRESA